ncbi:MAG TPA: epoxide hydrolase [Vicinamibacterales bacterium]|nr:epoxide hydrolase [Vicinamibacterales bacterium]
MRIRELALIGFVSVVSGWTVAAQRGPAPAPAGQEAIVPFRIQVPDAVLSDLRQRLARTRFPGEIAGSEWDYGTNLGYLKELVAYWREKFDWRAAERRLNQFDQFTTKIDGLDIHFIHQRSKDPKALPLAVTHGWPGSVAEFTKIIGPLTNPAAHGGSAADAFHVVAISLPGFGFSGKPAERGYGPERIAGIIAKLMARLGYTRYGLQGGDWGSAISRFAALNDASHVAGLHVNFCLAGPPPGVKDPNEGVTPVELERSRARQAFFETERGYFLEQSTKPQTIGSALDDSPAGLAAWIVEKFRSWSDSDGNVEKSFTKDDLLTNITIYWVTQTATSSARIYYENQRAKPAQGRVQVPTACAVFPKEISIPPRRWVEAQYNVTRWTEMPRGGHFAALEEPELLVEDIRAFFRMLR